MHSVTDKNSSSVQTDVSSEAFKINQSSSSSIFCFLNTLDDKSNSFSLRNEQRYTNIFDSNEYTHCGDEPSGDVLNDTVGEVLEKGAF